ncbi:MAG: hypothetical protein M3619_25990, partial [Myxococcota bacterium]|nr:hypothetical protein [Myxococcota bacterium]
MRMRPPRRLVSGLAIGCAVLAFGSADAAPLAKASDDVDGDGKLDELELDGDGTLRVGGMKRGTFRLPAGATKVRILVARGQLVLDATTPASREAIVVDARSWRELTRFSLGGIGNDREYGMEVAVTAAGIVRYQTRWDVRRCDGKPAYLFAERLDGTTFRPMGAPPLDVPPSAPLLRAKVDVAAAAPLLYQARAASHQPGASDAGGLAIPRELDDGRTDTQWREDIAGTTGEGQFFTFMPRAEAAQAIQLRIVPGNPTSPATMKTFNRPRVLAVVSARGAWRVELPDAAERGAGDPLGVAYVADLPQPIAGCVTVVIESTYGKSQGTTAIAELGVYAEGERTGGGEALLARVVAQGQSGSTTAAAALARRGA